VQTPKVEEKARVSIQNSSTLPTRRTVSRCRHETRLQPIPEQGRVTQMIGQNDSSRWSISASSDKHGLRLQTTDIK